MVLETVVGLDGAVTDVVNHDRARVEVGGASVSPVDAIKIGSRAIGSLVDLDGKSHIFLPTGDKVVTGFKDGKPTDLTYHLSPRDLQNPAA